MSEKPLNATVKIATAQTFVHDVIEGSKTTPVLVDFWAEWCGPCKQLMPVLDRLATEYGGRFTLCKVNTDEQQELAAKVGVRSLPTVVLFKGGTAVDHFVGAVPEGQIRQMLDRHLPSVQKSPIQIAQEMAAAGRLHDAVAALEQALAKDTANIDLQCALAEMKVLLGDLEAGKQALDAVKAREPNAPAAKRLTALIEFNDVVKANPDVAALRESIAAKPDDLEARHALAVHRLLAADYDAALEDWLDMMRVDRKFKDDLARKSLVMAFDLIGHQDPRVAQTRREMARMLF